MTVTTYKNIISNKFNLAPSQLMTLGVPNKNKFFIRDLLSRKLKSLDNGNEVGSINYISNSPKYFIRAKALQKESFLPFITDQTAVPIRPQVFTDFNLKEEDILISKDSNIGEVVILDKDLSSYTISGALYRLPIVKNKFYLFAFLKHKYFKKQLDIFVPKGSTIRHAKTLFLDCKIPFPNQKDSNDVIKYVELLTRVIINKEKKIREKNQQIFKKIEKELLENQKNKKFNYELPKFNEIKKNERLDASLYVEECKYYKFVIKNYKNGFYFLDKKFFKGGSTPKERERIFDTGNIKWITPTIINKFGTLKRIDLIAIKNNKYNIKKDCLILVNRGDKIDLAQSFFYDFSYLGVGQHNQGCYRIEDKDKKELLFLTCLLNSNFYRNFISYLGLGSKMPEIKINQLTSIPFPNFPQQKQKEIAGLYYNPIKYPKKLNLKNFLENDQKWNEKAGIIELDKSVKKMKEYLNSILDKIVDDEKIKVNFDF